MFTRANKKFRCRVTVALFSILFGIAPAIACPFCKDAVSTDPSGTKTAEAASLDFNASIYAMLAGLAGIGAFTGTAMYKAVAKSFEK